MNKIESRTLRILPFHHDFFDLNFVVEIVMTNGDLWNRICICFIYFLPIFLVNEYETNIVNLMDILGTVGGFYEILSIISSLFVPKLVDLFFKKNLQKNEHRENKEWFSYPSMFKYNKSSKRK